jgi:hypothetical protein
VGRALEEVEVLVEVEALVEVESVVEDELLTAATAVTKAELELVLLEAATVTFVW